jgi:hypothetical protein
MNDRRESRTRCLGPLVVLAMLAAACHTSPAAGPATTSPGAGTGGPTTSAALGPLTCTSVSGTLATTGVPVLQTVSVTAHSGYDAVVFGFLALPPPPVPTGPAAVVPTYTVEPATGPFAGNPSGRPVSVGGSAFLRIAFHDAYGTDPLNVPPQASYRGPTSLTFHVGPVIDVAEQGDNKGSLTWIVGLSRSACWRVVHASTPPALEVDVPS